MRLTKKERWLFGFYGFFILFSLVTAQIVEDFVHAFMIWNLFLAFIPYLITKFWVKLQTKKGWLILSVMGFILFLPNTFYLVSDLIYLSQHVFMSDPEPYQILIYYDSFESWLALFHLFISAMFGLSLGFLCLDELSRLIASYNKRWVMVGILISLLLSGLGIYIGRFFRYNSWDIFNLGQVITDLFEHLSLTMVGFIVFYALMIGALYGLYKIVLINEIEKARD